MTSGPAFAGPPALPDRKLTPGVVDPLHTKAVLCSPTFRTSGCQPLGQPCEPGQKKIRFATTADKRAVCRAYGIKTGCPGPKWELDDILPLTDGGKNERANLWPQPIKEAKVKDPFEDQVHKLLCSGKLTLQEEENGFRTNWAAFYAKVEGHAP